MNSVMNKINNMKELTMENVKSEYLLKKYKDEQYNPSALDLKMIDAIYNLRKNYKEEYDKRQCTIYLKNFVVQTTIKNTEKNIVIEDSKQTKEKSENAKNIICCAIKMNGEKCTSKIKEGCFITDAITGVKKPVCGRHKAK